MWIQAFQLHCCRKLPPVTGKYTTLRVEVPTAEIMENICPYSKREATIKTFAYSVIYYVSWKYYLILKYIKSKSMQKTETSNWRQA